MSIALIALGFLALVVAIIAVRDLTQRQHAVTRNFPVLGHFRYWFEEMGQPLRQYLFAGDLEEPTMFVFDGPLPESEEVADLFALLGILDPAELEQGPVYVEDRIRQLVPLENYGWATYRVPRLATKVVVLWQLMTRRIDG